MITIEMPVFNLLCCVFFVALDKLGDNISNFMMGLCERNCRLFHFASQNKWFCTFRRHFPVEESFWPLFLS